ncbi:MAG: hypothetical protein AAF411_19860 [Myxococcota bacterium]
MSAFARPLALACVLTFGAFGTSFAQEAETPSAADADGTSDERASAFRAVSGPEIDRVPGGALLVGAYGAAFVLLVLFVWRIGRVNRLARQELESLRASLAERDGS